MPDVLDDETFKQYCDETEARLQAIDNGSYLRVRECGRTVLLDCEGMISAAELAAFAEIMREVEAYHTEYRKQCPLDLEANK